jgi:hypothetical protein
MESAIEGFAFNDFCVQCQRVMEHKIVLDGNQFSGTCGSCGNKRPMMDPNQVYYPKNDLWVTRFKIGNLPNVVTGKLIDSAKHSKKTV